MALNQDLPDLQMWIMAVTALLILQSKCGHQSISPWDCESLKEGTRQAHLCDSVKNISAKDLGVGEGSQCWTDLRAKQWHGGPNSEINSSKLCHPGWGYSSVIEFLACMRPWVRSLVMPKKKKKQNSTKPRHCISDTLSSCRHPALKERKPHCINIYWWGIICW
jgi:hypothetical protein